MGVYEDVVLVLGVVEDVRGVLVTVVDVDAGLGAVGGGVTGWAKLICPDDDVGDPDDVP